MWNLKQALLWAEFNLKQPGWYERVMARAASVRTGALLASSASSKKTLTN